MSLNYCCDCRFINYSELNQEWQCWKDNGFNEGCPLNYSQRGCNEFEPKDIQ
ncbi:hypothetical protein CLHUN_01910 [Ruminiclostridium hungatei]|uniref:Uncharacterized protein n=1 Tax=Ruminiclostridium hungatei TaxID=48256 RepID=A0A1V4SSF0_RUMHU|nr:hypothetical protein CLHUN_01910 [Ruminiclostridium hungatei]